MTRFGSAMKACAADQEPAGNHANRLLQAALSAGAGSDHSRKWLYLTPWSHWSRKFIFHVQLSCMRRSSGFISQQKHASFHSGLPLQDVSAYKKHLFNLTSPQTDKSRGSLTANYLSLHFRPKSCIASHLRQGLTRILGHPGADDMITFCRWKGSRVDCVESARLK